MRTVIRIPVRPPLGRSVHIGRRPGNTLVGLGILSLAITLATWREVPSSIVVPAAVTFGSVLVLFGVRRALRDASCRIDTILREELGSPSVSDRELAKLSSIPRQGSSTVNQRVDLERREGMIDDHRGGADDACPIARAGLDDAQLRGGQRQ